ncbi:MAG TPA: F0F1 ATP synthase subunit delta [Jiangellaceae bacterium]|nr:F0F1 ATP synthase subunit delta [Jiangellaceae bacterium]
MAAPGALADRLASAVGQSSEQAVVAGDALIAIAGFLASRASLRRALTDPGRSADSREALARQLFGGKVDEAALDVVGAAVGSRWARTGALISALSELGVQAHLISAEIRGQLDVVEEELFRFSQTVRIETALRSALLDRSAPEESRRQLVRTLLEGKAQPETVRLVENAVLERREGGLEKELDRIVDLAAARRRRKVAVARVAAPLTDEHRDRLQRALSTQAGADVQLNVVVEPELVGGIRVEIGDEVVDGTVIGRLEDARRQLAGSR